MGDKINQNKTPPQSKDYYSKLFQQNRFDIFNSPEFPPISTNNFVSRNAGTSNRPRTFSQTIQCQPLNSPSTISTKNYTPNKNNNEKYTSTDNMIPIIVLPYELCQIPINFPNITNTIFQDSNTHYIIENKIKNRLFYEYILVDTESIDITHNKDTRNPNKIAFSKIRIKKFLLPEEWGNYSKEKSFSSNQNFPLKYNYHDYIQAWYNTLYLRPFDHSWFIYFCKNVNIQKIPSWFLEWWYYFGPTIKLFPEPILKGFESYKNSTNNNMYKLPKILSFMIIFNIPWIMTWTYQVQQILPTPHPKHLVRSIRFKFWEKYNQSQADINAVFQWNSQFMTSTKTIATSTSASSSSENINNFINQKTKWMTELAKITDPNEYNKKMKEIMEETSSSTSAENSQDTQDSNIQDAQDPNNEDNYEIDFSLFD